MKDKIVIGFGVLFFISLIASAIAFVAGLFGIIWSVPNTDAIVMYAKIMFSGLFAGFIFGILMKVMMEIWP